MRATAGCSFRNPGAASPLLVAVALTVATLIPCAARSQRPRVDLAQGIPAVASGFDHGRHEPIACAACHGTGERHRTLLVRTREDCNACHHHEQRADRCLACHARATLPEPGRIAITLPLSVWSEARPRNLRFGHALHSEVECTACHAAPGTRAMVRTCGSCHGEHHGPAAACSACHSPPPATAHDAAAHLSCAGRGCHSSQAAPVPTLSRNLCLACHPKQAAHETGGECALCHEVPQPGAAVSKAAGPEVRP